VHADVRSKTCLTLPTLLEIAIYQQRGNLDPCFRCAFSGCLLMQAVPNDQKQQGQDYIRKPLGFTSDAPLHAY
jgi:hypothetical protein